MATKLIRIAMVLLMLVGIVLTANAAEYDWNLLNTMIGIITLFSGMVGIGLTYCVTVRKGGKDEI